LSATHYIPLPARDRPTAARRTGSFLLALAIEVLLLLAFFTLNFREPSKPVFEGGRLSTFDLSADTEADATKSERKQEEAVTRPKPRPALPIPKPKIELPKRPLQMIEVTPEEFHSSDIARLGTAANGPSGPQMAEGHSPGDSEKVGTAPNGEPLYAAEWYREPTHTELSAYLPKNMPENGGWGMVACKTADRYHVTDCVELGNSPPGSHLANAVRQAAWQFLVRPPRIGGKPMIGEWVRIQITYQTVGHSGGFAEQR
jgi:protein TonB